MALVKHGEGGLYNMTCQGETSRLEVARFIVACLGMEKKLSVIEVDSSFYKNEYFAPRPRSERLVNAKLKQRGLDLMRDWRVALAEYLEQCFLSQTYEQITNNFRDHRIGL
jgi:dTDP-4-dehydrorhamnose reductase